MSAPRAALRHLEGTKPEVVSLPRKREEGRHDVGIEPETLIRKVLQLPRDRLRSRISRALADVEADDLGDGHASLGERLPRDR